MNDNKRQYPARSTGEELSQCVAVPGDSADEVRSDDRPLFRPDRAQRFYRDNAEMIFISHDASVTGAPILLLTLLEWWRRAGGPPFRIVLRAGGRLESRFRELGRVWNLDWPTKLTVALPGEQAQLLSFCGPSVRLAYANTAAVGDVVAALDPLGVPVLAHVHELETMLAKHIGAERFQLLKDRATHYVAPASAVAENLVRRHGVSSDRITVVPEYLPESFAGEAMACIESPVIVLGAGTTDSRKGPDLFVAMAAEVKRRLPAVPVRFVWVGGPTEPGQIEALQRAVSEAGLGGVADFVGEQADLRPFYRRAAVFVSSSREDPYPVVCLEAAAHGLPVVCFAGAGGMPEFVRNDAGRVVQYLDTMAMAAAVVELLLDEAGRRSAGLCGRLRVFAENTVPVCGARLRALAEAMVASKEVRS